MNKDKFQNIMLPMVRRVTPALIADEILGVQPMAKPYEPKSYDMDPIGVPFSTEFTVNIKNVIQSSIYLAVYPKQDPDLKKYLTWLDDQGLELSIDYAIERTKLVDFWESTYHMKFLFKSAEDAVQFKLTFSEDTQ